jgi:hypothetical protein
MNPITDYHYPLPVPHLTEKGYMSQSSKIISSMTEFIYDRFAKELLTTLLSTIGTVHVHQCVNSEVQKIDQEKPATEAIHDRFAKNFLQELLSPLGTVNVKRDVISEIHEIDIYFTQTTSEPQDIENLGLLGRIASPKAIFEPFGNPVTKNDIWDCMSKFLNLRVELEKQFKKENTPWDISAFPMLWILTPTASDDLLTGFGALPNEANWMKGMYFFGSAFRSAIVVIHQLPETPETLWLRILGRGEVQQRAIAELRDLAVDNPLRISVLELLDKVESHLGVDSETEADSKQ